MDRMKKNDTYSMMNIGSQSNQYMDNIVNVVNNYIDQSYSFNDMKEKYKAYSTRKKMTDDEIKKQYDELVKKGYIKTQSYADYYHEYKEKELEYDQVVSHIDLSVKEYEEATKKAVSFLMSIREQYIHFEQTLLNATALGLNINPESERINNITKEINELTDRLGQASLSSEERKAIVDQIKNLNIERMNLQNKTENERAKLLYAIKQINNYVAEMEKNTKLVTSEISVFKASIDPSKKGSGDPVNTNGDPANTSGSKNSGGTPSQPNNFDDYLSDYGKRLEEYHEKYEKYEEELKNISELYDKASRGEISKEDYEKAYANFKIKSEEIEKDYEDISKYRLETLDKISKGEIWHPSLMDKDLEELKKLGITKPEGSEYDNFLASKNIGKDYILEPKLPSKFDKKIDDIKKPSENPKQEENGNSSKKETTSGYGYLKGRIRNVSKNRISKLGPIVVLAGAGIAIGLVALGAIVIGPGIGAVVSSAAVGSIGSIFFGAVGLASGITVFKKALKANRKLNDRARLAKNINKVETKRRVKYINNATSDLAKIAEKSRDVEKLQEAILECEKRANFIQKDIERIQIKPEHKQEKYRLEIEAKTNAIAELNKLKNIMEKRIEEIQKSQQVQTADQPQQTTNGPQQSNDLEEDIYKRFENADEQMLNTALSRLKQKLDNGEVSQEYYEAYEKAVQRKLNELKVTQTGEPVMQR